MSTGAPTLLASSGPVPVNPPVAAPATPAWQLLPAATLRAWHLDNLIGLLVAVAALGIAATLGLPPFLRQWLLPLAGLAVVAAVLESSLLLPRRHRCYRYAITPASLVVESGALVRRQLVVPLHQVLYVESHQGPVLRAYGLTRVRLGTIADARSVGPLTSGQAAALRHAVELRGPTRAAP